ncbi:MAG: hypothetical protein H0Z39_10620 [Peptococcaceae bacterium]|nr:hypothetical protein [Peptococcaceae bacterium]
MALYISRSSFYRFICFFLTLFSLWLVVGHVTIIHVQRNNQSVEAKITFLTPMNRKAVDKIDITSEIEGKPVRYQTQWDNHFTLRVIINEEDYPRGLKYTIRLSKAPALIWPFTVTARHVFQTKVAPAVLDVCPAENAPTTGPVKLRFNTTVAPDNFNDFVHCDYPGSFKPFRYRISGRFYEDLSQWQFIPRNRMLPDHVYVITVKKGLKSKAGLALKKDVKVQFRTAQPFLCLETYPKNGAPSVWLTRQIKITTNQKLQDARIEVSGVDGITRVEGTTAKFLAARTFRPNTTYKVKARLTSVHGEQMEKTFSFHTTNLGQQNWLEIKLGTPCRIWWMRGSEEMHEFEGWSTREPSHIPKVTMYEMNRISTQNEKNTESLPWIRLNADILIHALPQGAVDDHRALGLPQTYACIIIPKEELAKIIDFPPNFMVIVH